MREANPSDHAHYVHALLLAKKVLDVLTEGSQCKLSVNQTTTSLRLQIQNRL